MLPPQRHAHQQQQQQHHSQQQLEPAPTRLRRPAAPPHAAADEGSAGDLPATEGLQARLVAGSAWLDALYRFSRPHTMLGTAVSVCSVSALALAPGQAGTVAATALAQALSSALLMNICIVGINQVRVCVCMGWLAAWK